jgi:hypothetical protein
MSIYNQRSTCSEESQRILCLAFLRLCDNLSHGGMADFAPELSMVSWNIVEHRDLRLPWNIVERRVDNMN